jgi:nicotinate-nucleotide adenylyltransferase
MPVPPGVPLVVLIGGTFDPPHRAHIDLPLKVRDELERRGGEEWVGEAWLVYIPAARSPHKGTGPVASDADRVNMLRLALADRERTGVWTDEIDRAAHDAPSYTIDTLRRARQWLDGHGGADTQLRLLIGADQAMAFHRWRDPHAIVALAEPALMLRPPVDTAKKLVDAMLATGEYTAQELLDTWSKRFVDVGVIEAAATSVREALAARSSNPTQLRAVLDERVLDYITAHHLYQGAGRPPAAEPPGHRAPG